VAATDEKTTSAFETARQGAILGGKRRLSMPKVTFVPIKKPRIEHSDSLKGSSSEDLDPPTLTRYTRSFSDDTVVLPLSIQSLSHKEKRDASPWLPSNEDLKLLVVSEDLGSSGPATDEQVVLPMPLMIPEEGDTEIEESTPCEKKERVQKTNAWTQKELKMCVALYRQGMPLKEIAQIVKRTDMSVRTKLFKYRKACNLKPKVQILPNAWTPEDLKTCETLYIQGEAIPEIAKKIGRTAGAVRKRLMYIRKEKNLRPRGDSNRFIWTDEKVNQCIKLAEKGTSVKEIARLFGCPDETIRGKLVRMNKLEVCREAGGVRSYQFWSERDIELCVKLAQQGAPISKIADRLGRSTHCIREKLKKLGIAIGS